MNDHDLMLIVAAFKQRHPSLLPQLKVLTAQCDETVATAATALLHCLLTTFDEAEQLRWQMRDMLKAVKRYNASGEQDAYWALKYNATKMVHLLALCGGADTSKTTYYALPEHQPDELKNWKSEIPDA